MKIKIVYFLFLKEGRWEDILEEQLGNLKKLELYDLAESIFLSPCGNHNEFSKLIDKINKNYPKIEIINYSEQNVFEYPGIKTIYEVSEKNSLILYFHSKGIFSGSEKETNNQIRKMLFKLIVENYKSHIEEFLNNQELSVSTLYPSPEGTTWYNFFWVRGDFVKNYMKKPEIQKNRFFWEHWFVNSSLTKEIIFFSPILKYERITNKIDMYKKNEELFKLLN